MTKSELKKAYFLKQELKQIERRIEELNILKSSPKSQQITGMPIGNNKNNSIETIVMKIDELNRKYQKIQCDIASEILKIENVIDSLEPIERILIRYRYIENLKWEEICIKLSYSWGQIHRLHNKALQNLKYK